MTLKEYVGDGTISTVDPVCTLGDLEGGHRMDLRGPGRVAAWVLVSTLLVSLCNAGMRYITHTGHVHILTFLNIECG